MGVFVSQVDAVKIQEKYGQPGSLATFCQNTPPSNQRKLSDFFVFVSNPDTFELCGLNDKYEETSHQQIAKADIQNLKVSGLLVKKVSFEANGEKYNFWFKPLVMGAGKHQKAMVNEFKKLK